MSELPRIETTPGDDSETATPNPAEHARATKGLATDPLSPTAHSPTANSPRSPSSQSSTSQSSVASSPNAEGHHRGAEWAGSESDMESYGGVPVSPRGGAQLKRGAWSPQEDEKLVHLVETMRPLKWVNVAQAMQTRTSKQCRERYHNYLKPSLTRTPISKEEGRKIEELVAIHGKRWAEISRQLHGRSDNAIKNWWNASVNRRRASQDQTASNSVPLMKKPATPSSSQISRYSSAGQTGESTAHPPLPVGIPPPVQPAHLAAAQSHQPMQQTVPQPMQPVQPGQAAQQSPIPSHAQQPHAQQPHAQPQQHVQQPQQPQQPHAVQSHPMYHAVQYAAPPGAEQQAMAHPGAQAMMQGDAHAPSIHVPPPIQVMFSSMYAEGANRGSSGPSVQSSPGPMGYASQVSKRQQSPMTAGHAYYPYSSFNHHHHHYNPNTSPYPMTPAHRAESRAESQARLSVTSLSSMGSRSNSVIEDLKSVSPAASPPPVNTSLLGAGSQRSGPHQPSEASAYSHTLEDPSALFSRLRQNSDFRRQSTDSSFTDATSLSHYSLASAGTSTNSPSRRPSLQTQVPAELVTPQQRNLSPRQSRVSIASLVND